MNQNQQPSPRRHAPDKPAQTAKKRPVKRKKRRVLLRAKNPHLWRNIGIAVVVAAAVFFTVSIFFKVSSVQVTGNSYYSAQQVIDASGIQQGDNLMALSKATVSGRICQELPYVRSVQIRKNLPNEIILSVEETSVAYAVKDNAGVYWLITSEGKIIGKAENGDVGGYVLVTGFVIQNPVPGESMKAAGSEQLEAVQHQLDLTCNLLTALEQCDFGDKIVSVDVPSDYNVSCWYGDQFKVIFGDTEDFSYKLRYLAGVIAKLDSFASGEIDLRFQNQEEAIYRPAN